MQLWSDDIETDAASAGENVKIKLQGVEEEVSRFFFSVLSKSYIYIY